MKENKQTIYQRIRADIIEGVFLQDEKLTESKLAKRYNVSRTPIREAIRQLEHEYFLESSYIKVPSSEEYRQLFELRILYETYAIEKACFLFNEEDISELEDYTKIDYDDEKEKIIYMNNQFHKKIMSATRNEFLQKHYLTLSSYIFLFSKTVIEKKRAGLIEEHKEIVQALHERDSKKAANLLRKHLENDLEFTLFYLKC